MPPKPPTGTTDVVARYVREMARTDDRADAIRYALTGAKIKAGAASSRRPKTLESRPRCATCDKPVEDFTEEDDEFSGQLVFVARCHGATERVRLAREVVEVGKSIDFGLAFVPANRLPAPAPAPQKLLPPKETK